MNSNSNAPWFPVTLGLAVVGAVLPVVALIRGGGVSGIINDVGLLVTIWGLSPFILFPLAARLAKRSWVHRMVLVLASAAVLCGMVGYLVLLPRRTGTDGTLLYVFLPIWQWPMSLLAGLLSVFVPSEEQERHMSEVGKE